MLQLVINYQNLMKKNLSQKNPKKAFSLLELSIVILIISILIVGSMSASVTAINNAKYKVTRDRMAEIYKAMGSYLLTNKALPCPASLKNLKSDVTTGPSYGIAGSAGTCALDGVFIGGSLAYGMVPVQALGLNTDMAEDGFGSRFTYVVATTFTNPSVTTNDTTGFGRAPETSIMTVKESLTTTAAAFQTNTTDAIFVIISHGANKYGAFNNNSSTQNTASTDLDEQKNYGTSFVDGAGTADTVTISSYFVPTSVNSDAFDDVFFYKTRNTMLIDFNALSLIVCKNGATNGADYSIAGGAITTAFPWPATTTSPTYYGQIVASTDTCTSHNSSYVTTVTYPTKRCGAFGVWQPGALNPCTN